MTDLATRSSADDAQSDDAVQDAADAPDGGGPDAPTYAWAPAEPAPRRRRTGLWIGIAAGAAVIGLVVSSLVLIAPGTTVAGVPIGGMTAGAAADAIDQSFAGTVVVLTGEGGDVELTAADLGATVDSRTLAEDAFAERPMWNVSQWFTEPADVEVTIDEATAEAALRAAAPDLYVDPVDATLAYDSQQVRYVWTAAEEGAGVDVESIRVALQDAFAEGSPRVELTPAPAAIAPTVTTESATSTADTLNNILEHAGFYVGDQRAVKVSPATAASWLTVAQTADGGFEISADEAAIQEVVDTLPDKINRDAVDAKVITDSGGAVLQTNVAGVAGRELGSTASVASDYAAQLATGKAKFKLPVNVTDYETIATSRRIDVNLSTQTTTLYQNGKVYRSWAISSGLPATPTPTGNFRVFAHTAIQDLGALCYDPTRTDSYCTEDVPWLTWFAPDIAFHGAYWHNNFGNQMSHGCVNMPINVAKFVYDWAPIGTEVSVHY
ncbi:L,D-transpeptidase family protein [Microbacterium thalassium]|uniref:Lipoprotein-anchoring transpeptidase ErfK/SrfK n=1 Tax=Microbacterium thalassium TaxID=362649 RepID=A0A7X0FP98_9MICO|nr:L,D-transpeptidase family protein [Microbacterium thalassium]MBB6391198.1 lipoprotein-anchoring transpeptidase ErfK/SrfK [Microbacterium thalassium]